MEAYSVCHHCKRLRRDSDLKWCSYSDPALGHGVHQFCRWCLEEAGAAEAPESSPPPDLDALAKAGKLQPAPDSPMSPAEWTYWRRFIREIEERVARLEQLESSHSWEAQADMWAELDGRMGALETWVAAIRENLGLVPEAKKSLASRVSALEEKLEQATRLPGGPLTWYKCPHCGELAPMLVGPNPSGEPSELSKPASPTLGQTPERGTSADPKREECSSTD